MIMLKALKQIVLSFILNNTMGKNLKLQYLQLTLGWILIYSNHCNGHQEDCSAQVD